MEQRPLAVVTGASSGIGFELAKCCAGHGFDLVVAADEAAIEEAAVALRELGVAVDAVETDLSTTQGVDKLYAAIGSRAVDALLANAGRGLGHGFLEQSFADIRSLIDTNLTGTLYLLHLVGRDMQRRGQGRILITGSIVGYIPGPYHAVYNGTKAFLNNFSFGLRHELKDSGVTVTCLMPGATDTQVFETAGMGDTTVGASKKDDPATVAADGFKAMMAGEGDIVSGWQNKVLTAIASVTPSDVLAEVHRRMAQPGTGG